MSHVSSPVLRRLHDEPRAVPDSAQAHLAGCSRCQARHTTIRLDARMAARLLTAPGVTADPDLAWERLQARLRGPRPGAAAARVARPRRMTRLSLGTGTLVTAGVVLAGAGAAAALSTVYTPTHVAPVPVSRGDLRALSSITQVGLGQLGGGLPPSGVRQLPFGTLSWTSAGPAETVTSLAQARAQTHLPVTGPASLPSGVGPVPRVMVQPKLTVTIRFSRDAGGAVGGSTLVVSAGPGVVAQYGSSSGGSRLTTLVIAAVQRPVATSTGATARQLEAFLLSRPGLPSSLAQEIRMLGTTALPVPVPPGMTSRHVTVGGSPAVLLTGSAVATGVAWEDSHGVVHGVGGLLNQTDILHVARQIG
ncbi:MAG TPA: hypothetical protein VGG35_23180 [Streptosporangiaceae bacterium]|jgi:hypothetical protein